MNEIVKYPRSIKGLFKTAEEMCDMECGKPLLRMLKSAGLPAGTRFTFFTGKSHSSAHILLPDGKIFTGFAFLSPKDNPNMVEGLMYAFDRALATWEASREKFSVVMEIRNGRIVPVVFPEPPSRFSFS